MSTRGPAHTYYSQAQGRWRGRMRTEIHSVWATIKGLGLFNAMSVLMMGYLPAWLGTVYLETTVEYTLGEPVRHTTQVTCWGITMMRSEEHVHIDKNGIDFRIEGQSHHLIVPFLPWRQLTMTGTGSNDATARHATYTLDWLGTQFEQTTDRRADSVTLRQQAAGFTSAQDLEPYPG